MCEEMNMKRLILLSIVTLLFTGCNNSSKQKETFKSWNGCSALTTLKEYVKDVTNKKSKNYIPVEDRIATFDMDGTFVGELYPTYFEYNLLEYRVLEDESYKNSNYSNSEGNNNNMYTLIKKHPVNSGNSMIIAELCIEFILYMVLYFILLNCML